MKVTVINSGHNSAEAAGHVFPPRARVTATVHRGRLAEIEDNPRLSVEESSDGGGGAGQSTGQGDDTDQSDSTEE